MQKKYNKFRNNKSKSEDKREDERKSNGDEGKPKFRRKKRGSQRDNSDKEDSKFRGKRADRERSRDKDKPKSKKRILFRKKKPPQLALENPTTVELKKTGIRLNKYLANSGVAARRKADELIKEGWVTVNGNTITEMGFRVQADDIVKFKNKKVEPQNKTYILMNKPKDMITTTNDPQGRKTVMDLVASVDVERLYPVGRLDRNTVGLLLLTNDGSLAQYLSHPKTEVRKIYHVFLDKPLQKSHLNQIGKGIKLEDGEISVDGVSYMSENKKEIGIQIHSGRNRIVRRIFEYFGYEINKLDRVIYGGLTKKNLTRGKWRFLTAKEVIMLKHFKG
ncbi:MAG: pseudouridine synthase [Chitinophagales bacterium]